MGKLFEELKRRKVFRIAAVYAVVAWMLIQVADVVLPTFGAPGWVNQTLIFLFILGFPIALVLAWAYEVSPEGIHSDAGAPSPTQSPAPQNQYLIYATFALVLLVAGFQIADRFFFDPSRSDSAELPGATTTAASGVMRSSLLLDQPLIPRPWNPNRTEMELTADGTTLFYVDHERMADGTISSLLYSRNMATQETQLFGQIYGPAEVSPDGRLISAGDNIYSIQGGSLQNQIPRNIGGRAAWLSNDEIIYVGLDFTVHRTSLITGEDESLSPLEGAGRHGNPHTLPGGRAFLYNASNVVTDYNTADIRVYDLNSGETKTVFKGGYQPQYTSSGHLVFIREGDMLAASFDLESLEIVGPVVKVIEGISSQPYNGRGSFTFSDSGRLVYLPGPEQSPIQAGLRWIDRFGNTEDIPLPPGNYLDPELSPDGQSLAVTLVQIDGTSDVWVYDLSRQSFGRRTFFEKARNPKWTPDGNGLVFHVTNQGIWTVNADGTGQPEQLTSIPEARPDSFVAQSNELLYLSGPIGTAIISKLSYNDSTWISEPLIVTNNNTWSSAVSPDGRWIAYTSQETGNFEVFVQPYPNLESGKWQISTRGGREPKWSPDGTELFYLTNSGTLMTVSLETESAFTPGPPQAIASDFFIYAGNPPNYAVTNDGQRFIQFPVTNESPIEFVDNGGAVLTVVENWFEELNRLAPPDPQ